MDLFMIALCLTYFLVAAGALVTAMLVCVVKAWEPSTRAFMVSLAVAISVTPFAFGDLFTAGSTAQNIMTVLFVGSVAPAVAFGLFAFVVHGIEHITKRIRVFRQIVVGRTGLYVHLSSR